MEIKSRFKPGGFLSSLTSPKKDIDGMLAHFTLFCEKGKIPVYDEAEEVYALLLELNGSAVHDSLIAIFPAVADNILGVLISKKNSNPDERLNDKLFESSGMDRKFIRLHFGKEYLEWKIVNDMPESKREQDVFIKYCESLADKNIITSGQKEKIEMLFKLCESLLVVLKKIAIFSKDEVLKKKISSSMKELLRESLFISPLAEKALADISENLFFALK